MSETSITTRPATIEDLPFAWQIYLGTMRYITDRQSDFDEARHKARFFERFLPHEVRVVMQDSNAIGWLQISEKDDEIFLKQVFLQPASQGQGIGSGLISDLLYRGHQVNMDLPRFGGEVRIFIHGI
jgi:GNAT superfamily N-acetyltransferase